MTQTLNARQQRFVTEYLTDLNATQSAIRAGYSEKTAASTANENLRKPKIVEAVLRGMQERQERIEHTGDEVVARLFDIVFADLRQVVEWDDGAMRLKPSDDIPDHVHGAISSIKERRSRRAGEGDESWEIEYREIKMAERSPYMKLLMQHLGLLAPTKVELSTDPERPLHVAALPWDLTRLTDEQLLQLDQIKAIAEKSSVE